MKHYFFGLVSLFSSLVFPFALLADSVHCEYSEWRGARSEAIALSWLGTGFVGDTKRSTVKFTSPNGDSNVYKTGVVEKAKFTDFTLSIDEKTSQGETLRMRYILRVYSTGKCEGRAYEAGFEEAIIAEGWIKS